MRALAIALLLVCGTVSAQCPGGKCAARPALTRPALFPRLWVRVVVQPRPRTTVVVPR